MIDYSLSLSFGFRLSVCLTCFLGACGARCRGVLMVVEVEHVRIYKQQVFVPMQLVLLWSCCKLV